MSLDLNTIPPAPHDSWCPCVRCLAELPAEDEPCEHKWEYRDDSFDHAFGTEKIPPYEKCLLCDEVRDLEPQDQTYTDD